MAGNTVITWNNDGLRAEHKVAGQVNAIALAKTFRTLNFRTVKVADALGSTRHWSRSIGVSRNHWTAKAVADIACH